MARKRGCEERRGPFVSSNLTAQLKFVRTNLQFSTNFEPREFGGGFEFDRENCESRRRRRTPSSVTLIIDRVDARRDVRMYIYICMYDDLSGLFSQRIVDTLLLSPTIPVSNFDRYDYNRILIERDEDVVKVSIRLDVSATFNFLIGYNAGREH